MSHDDFAFEPVRGLPEHLPPGENILWQGAPDWWAIARSVFHFRVVAAYFGLMIGWRIISAIYDQRPALEAAASVLWMAGLAACGCGILALLAWATAKTTVYTLTSERLVMRIGIALPITLNIPYTKVDSAATKIGADGIGDITLSLMKGEKISYAVLWPHVRPWRMKRPEPMLRRIPNAAHVAGILARSLAAALSRPDTRMEMEPATDVRQLRPAAQTPEMAEQRKIRIA